MKLLPRYAGQITQQYALHEGAVSEDFQTLLADAGRPHHWTLIPQLTEKRDGKSIRPDGTFKDIFSQVRGYWKNRSQLVELLGQFRDYTPRR